MSAPIPPPTDRPWWKRWWGIVYIISLGCTVACTLAAAALPADRGGSGVGFGVAALWLGLLVETGVGVAILRRDGSHDPTSPELVFLLTLFLVGLCAIAVVGLCAFSCAAGGVK